MKNPDHDLDIIAMGHCISKYLLTLPRNEAIGRLKEGYSKEALESLYNTAMEQEDYEVCSIIKEVI
jgi:hypothetical protein